jgi:hypothetical protein
VIRATLFHVRFSALLGGSGPIRDRAEGEQAELHARGSQEHKNASGVCCTQALWEPRDGGQLSYRDTTHTAKPNYGHPAVEISSFGCIYRASSADDISEKKHAEQGEH